MKILIDMNLPPRWVQVFAEAGWEAVHWSQVGSPKASDREIMAWARENGYIVFTHDLDFSALLAATQGDGPSVIQVRTQNVLPEAIGELVVDSLRRFQNELVKGAIITIDPSRARIRILPLRS
jgi:predicted nuclease of predicted toxin-antitoxin system